MQRAQRVIGAQRRAMNADGFNVGLNLGEVAGAGIAEHLHLHVVPRWEGDTNFMPLLGDTHVIPQALEDTRRVLVEALER
jgi:ATP adenylyltransferase